MKRAVWAGVLLIPALLRFCHVNILWVEEAYPIAAVQQMRWGRMLYRDLWFDKPPGFALFYWLSGAEPGWMLRLVGACFVIATVLITAWAAKRVWGAGAALWAAGLTGFFFTFDIPAATLALTPDLLAAPLHAAALALAITGSPFGAGLVCGVALLVNTKAVLVLAACLLWQWRAMPMVLLGFLAPNAFTALWLLTEGALTHSWDQVWRWGAAYAKDTPFADPVPEGLRRTANWAGFHAVLVVGASVALRRMKRTDGAKWAGCVLLAVAAAWLGLRFFPRYWFHVLPPLVLLAARGLSSMPGRQAALACVLLLVPLARFGPRYAILAYDLSLHRAHRWGDLAMEQDSRYARQFLPLLPRRGETLLVWGYRPEIFALSDMPAGTRFLDSQPLNGVLADRHLTQSKVTIGEMAARNRAEVLRGRPPTWIIDGLGPYNPELAVFRHPDFRAWAGLYTAVGRTPGSRIYRRLPDPQRPIQAGSRF